MVSGHQEWIESTSMALTRLYFDTEDINLNCQAVNPNYLYLYLVIISMITKDRQLFKIFQGTNVWLHHNQANRRDSVGNGHFVFCFGHALFIFIVL